MYKGKLPKNQELKESWILNDGVKYIVTVDKFKGKWFLHEVSEKTLVKVKQGNSPKDFADERRNMAGFYEKTHSK